ncbi:sulfatase-like hydrolase/transferase [Novipirellula artificiosorum]|uniref:Arylsulfatase n=1 Tax=Novipirellula artificiosorum TaxID=2528016 RepID=A0A5C6D4C5_9BACT|nr:sulfatase-like hydrolase/transferase [Novipirellula artificiosorum]TWU31742.1 Arylsulfatase [Novipirellula artificiosorum]
MQQANRRIDPTSFSAWRMTLAGGDVGYNGHPHIKTPDLDQMAKSGARLDRFYVGSPLCVPSRAGLLTGRIATRCGISNHRGAVSHLKADEFTIAELVKAKGYATGHFGKWHLGMLTPDYKGDKSVLMTPGMAGFDEWFASPSSVPTHNPYTDPGGIGRALSGVSSPTAIDLRAGYVHNGRPLEKPIEGCAAEIVMDRAIPFIRDAAKRKQPSRSHRSLGHRCSTVCCARRRFVVDICENKGPLLWFRKYYWLASRASPCDAVDERWRPRMAEKKQWTVKNSGIAEFTHLPRFPS